ncbi:MAG: hypothetical protein DDT34_00264 [Firmicutes bacterium]|nr:hypothetical protein [Bacillota bacterium]MBT9152447.1 hypothetical protein [Bacillota bacterium]MBT9157318.1 hypothetical protein [Bacillota bacterium]
MKLSTRQIVISGLLTALTVVLGVTGWGFIPMPTPAGAATIMHIPVILAGMLEGPVVGGFVGLLFGLFSLRFLPDPLVVIPARLVIGLFAWLAFHGVSLLARRFFPAGRGLLGSLGLAGIAAGVAGTMANTIGTLVLAVLRGYITEGAAWTIALAQGVPELILAGFVVGSLAVVLIPRLPRVR